MIGGAGLAFVAAFALLRAGTCSRAARSGTHRSTSGTGSGSSPARSLTTRLRSSIPPGAFAVFVPGAIGAGEPEELTQYNRVFEGFMATFGLATIVLAGLVLRRLRATRARTLAALGFIALAPLALGAVYLSRFNAFPAALTVASLTLLVFERPRLAAGVLAAGLAAKLSLTRIRPARGDLRRTPLRANRACAERRCLRGGARCDLPSIRSDRANRAVRRTRAAGEPVASGREPGRVAVDGRPPHDIARAEDADHGRIGRIFIGSLPDAVATAQSVIQIALLVVIWMVFARGPTTPDRLIRFFAASLAAFIALSKVASPQFLIWLIPLVGLVGGRRGVASAAALTVALVLTQLWFPRGYWDLVAFEFPEGRAGHGAGRRIARADRHARPRRVAGRRAVDSWRAGAPNTSDVRHRRTPPGPGEGTAGASCDWHTPRTRGDTQCAGRNRTAHAVWETAGRPRAPRVRRRDCLSPALPNATRDLTLFGCPDSTNRRSGLRGISLMPRLRDRIVARVVARLRSRPLGAPKPARRECVLAQASKSVRRGEHCLVCSRVK